MKRPRGRPAKAPNDLITIEDAVSFLKEYLLAHYPPETAKKLELAKGTLYNKTAAGILHTWPRGRFALVSKADVIKLVS